MTCAWFDSVALQNIAGGELCIKSSYTFGPQSTWHIKIKIHLAIPNSNDVSILFSMPLLMYFEHSL